MSSLNDAYKGAKRARAASEYGHGYSIGEVVWREPHGVVEGKGVITEMIEAPETEDRLAKLPVGWKDGIGVYEYMASAPRNTCAPRGAALRAKMLADKWYRVEWYEYEHMVDRLPEHALGKYALGKHIEVTEEDTHGLPPPSKWGGNGD